MLKHVGIWMDKRKAIIIVIHPEGELMTTIRSNVEEFHPKGGSGTRLKGGPQDVVQDSKYMEREKHQYKEYFKNVISSLPEFDSLVVFGPAQTGHRFDKELATLNHSLHNKLVGVETADSLTDNQVVAWVKEYFGVNVKNQPEASYH